MQDDTGNATDIKVSDDPQFIVNLSVWESIEDLVDLTYRSEHRHLLQQRRDWFEPPEGPHLVLWWVPRGELPDVAGALDRLRLLAAEGPSRAAFTFARLYDPHGTPASLARPLAPR